MKRLVLLTLLATSLLTGSAGALQAIVWDRDLQIKLGYGELSSNKLSMRVVGNFSGPVVVLFARDDSEKNSFIGLQPRYDGFLKNGQLSVDLPDAAENVTFTKFLSSYKLTASLQNAGQNVSLPGLKASSEKDSKK